MAISPSPLPKHYFAGAANLSTGELEDYLNQVTANVMALGPPSPGVTVVNQKSDFGVAVNGVITLLSNWLYILNAVINLGSDVLKGNNISIHGNLTLTTILITNSSNAMISSDGDGFIQLVNVLATNGGGPFLDAELGAVPNLSILFLDNVRFSGDPLGDNSGIGTLGKVNGAEQVLISNCFFLDVVDGFQIDGAVPELSIQNSSIASRSGASAFTGLKVLATATLDIAVIGVVRFSTVNAADRCINLSPSATYSSPLRLVGSTIRGSGTFVDAASLQKSDPDFIAAENEGATAPIDSEFSGEATFLANTVQTVIGVGNQSVLLPVGNGNATHELFNGGAFTERFTLSGAETQLQKFTYDGKRPRTFVVDLHCQLNRVGGGTVLVGLAIQHDDGIGGDPVTIPSSVTETAVGNSSTGGFTKATLVLVKNCSLYLVMSNNSSEANLIMNSATWSVSIK